MRTINALTIGAGLCALPALLPAQDPPGSLDEAWNTVCAQAVPGTAFFERCQEIINAGPGSGDRRSAAAVGNNLGTTGAQGRTANRIDETRGDESGGIDYEEDFGRYSIHFNTNLRRTERDVSTLENGFESDLIGVNGGLDYRFGQTWSAGAVLGYQKADTDFDLGAGTLDTSGWSLTGVLDGRLGDNGYFNAYTGISSLEYDSLRNINYTIVLNANQPGEEIRSVTATANGDTDGDQIFAGASLGYGGNRGAFNYGFGVSADLLDTDIDGYTERGGNGLALVVGEQDIRSLTAALTGHFSYTNSLHWGILSPYARVRIEHEFDDDSRTQAPSFAGDPSGFQIIYETDDPDRDYVVAAVGFTGLMLSGTSWYAEVERLFMHDFFSEWSANAGIRFEF